MSFTPYPLGHTITGSPHSVCVSLPTMADVVGYEEKMPRVLNALQAGYPRFFRNPLIHDLAVRLSEEGCMTRADPLLPSEAAAIDLCDYAGIDPSFAAPIEHLWTVRLPGDAAASRRAHDYLQHTGSGISSREAEDALQTFFALSPFRENRTTGGPEADLGIIRQHLHEAYGTASPSDIRLYRSGMNAFYAGFRALQAAQLQENRDLWIQLGWLYVDTSRILQRFALPQAAPVTFLDVMDLAPLKEFLRREGHRVAAIVTEVPTNPLVQTPDLESLRQLADKAGAALVLDPSLVSPHNVNILSFSDIHINSLTKYAAASGDVMMGALALNPQSRFYDSLLHFLPAYGSSPASGDLARLASEISHYPETIRAVNASTERVADHLEGHAGIREVHWARRQPGGYHYNWLQHREAGPGGIVTFTTRRPLAEFYDRSRLVKSPSFGTRWTMMCPFMYLAHYDLVSTASGRAILEKQGLDPHLVRLSVGLEPVEAILEELDRTL